ncbi:hypothetical protein [Pseudomonas sp. S09G 359]|uniref:hypothetical protein n=1 Tax=Pseudomonas sp. S09G 359 TaxID=2054919 RepID=UPI000C6D31AA|nr:hypothetical protein [Pseudomonas sp. S09G 359]AUG09130.1 hypothetical protein CXQ82_22100 [Pseudomonas sp. S09G 359]
MAKELSASGVLACDNNPGELDSPAVTKTITIRRTVTRVCEVITDLNFTVPTQLPAPEVPEADGEILDLRNFNGDATVIIRKWAFLEEGQKGWLECLSTLKDGTAYTLQLMDGEPITANEVENGISRVLLREELEKLLHDSPLTIVFKTAVDACCEEGPVVVFPELELIYRQKFRDLTTFTDNDWNGWERGEAAYRDVDLINAHSGGNYFLVHDASDTRPGTLLTKEYDEFVVGVVYEFSVMVRRRNLLIPVPTLSLHASDGTTTIDVTDPVSFPTTTRFEPLRGTFISTARSMTLSVYTHQFVGPGGNGDDYDIDDLLVQGA